MLIIPAIDILDNKVVRLQQGRFTNNILYLNDPLETARMFNDNGFEMMHIVDLSASKTGVITTFPVLEKLTADGKLKIRFGGGVRSLEDVERLLDAGVHKIVLGSVPVINRQEMERIMTNIDPGKIICAADSYRGSIMIKGWTEEPGIQVEEHLMCCRSFGVSEFLCSDIERDGMLGGPNLDLYIRLVKDFPEERIIASGGIGSIEDIIKIKLTGVTGIIVGKAVYENRISLEDLKNYAG